MTPTEPQYSLFTRPVRNSMTDLLQAATKVANASTKTYFAVLSAIVEQQKLARQASLEWISEVTRVQSNTREQLAEGFDSVKGKLTDEAQEAINLASRGGAEVVKTSRDSAPSSSNKQRKAPAGTTRPTTRTTPRSMSGSTSQAGPARRTDEAYESLTVAQINETLPQFSQRELRDVETFEKAHQSRQTLLDKISALQGQEPVPGYDELTVQEIHELLTNGDDKLSASVRAYERPRKNRDGVLQAADAKPSK